jgi:AraC-like DNA-binding protein
MNKTPARTSAGTLHADPLSDVLDALRIDSSALHVFEFSAPWGVRIAGFKPGFSWTIIEGGVWLRGPCGEARLLAAGDSVVLPRGTGDSRYEFASAPGVATYPADDLWREAQLPRFEPGTRLDAPGVLRWGGGGALTRIVSTAFAFEDRLRGPLVDSLPDVMVVRANEAGSEFVEMLLRFPVGSGARNRPGFSAMATQTARLLLIHVVRTFALSRDGGQGWLYALSDAGLSRAIACIHRQPALEWSVAELAAVAGMSRSAFAKRFHDTLGQSPMRYLCEWRIHLAREALASGRSTVTTVAHDVGYSSEAAFRSAFRRSTGQQPREYRRTAGQTRK